MVLAFANKEEFCEIEQQVIKLIDNLSIIKDKIRVLHVFFRLITDNDFKSKTTQFLSDNFKLLDGVDIIEFMDGNWITFSEDNINQIFDDIILLSEKIIQI